MKRNSSTNNNINSNSSSGIIVEKERVEREKFEIPGNWFVFSA